MHAVIQPVSHRPCRASVSDDVLAACMLGCVLFAVCAGAGLQTALDPAKGTYSLPDRGTFDLYADRNNFPGAMQVPEVKFIIAGVDGPGPVLYFQNTKVYSYHYDFVVEALGWDIDLGTFDEETYFRDNRRNLAGSIIAYDDLRSGPADPGIYTLEFWPTDPVSFRLVSLAYDLVTGAMPFAPERVFYHPAGETQRGLHEQEKVQYEHSSLSVIQTEALFGDWDYAAMNPGEAYGRLRIIEGAETASSRDIVIFKILPNTLGHVAGIITEVQQTPLSHVNVKARQNHTPNAFIQDAATDPTLVPLLGSYVHFVVDPCGYRVEPATAEETDAFLESLRPKQPQSPRRDLSVKEIIPLDRLGFADATAFGAKAANVAELDKILPTGMAPEGCAVPFYFYDEFMKANHLYEQALAMMADPAFSSDLQQRDAALVQFRRSVRQGLMPDWMVKAMDRMVAQFPPGASLRCRSSTNNEDLPGFNGAGLYDSYTHYPEEGHISKTIKQVWASLWNSRAFDERDFYRIDHLATAMGVLVHPNYQDEQVNGVAVTQNIYDPNWPGSYVNVQLGEDLVTNPNEASIPEEFLVAYLAGEDPYEIQYIRWSNQIPLGQHLMTRSQIYELADQMAVIQEHFVGLYGRRSDDVDFAMEIEFKITAQGRLAIKQARPWVD